MKVLVIGSGGREHALCWKLSQSKIIDQVFCAPGNPGTAEFGRNLEYEVDDLAGLTQCALEHAIDFTIVGPELPLSLGIVDKFKEAGLVAFGPVRAAAALESSKSFAKEIMLAAGVPTAAYRDFEDFTAASEYLEQTGAPIVLKADGLAAGKGVFVCQTQAEARAALKKLFHEFNASKVVLEELLDGFEASYIVAVHGEKILPLAASHDYKRIGDNDSGPNTGGMGTVSPTPHLSKEQERWALDRVMRPVVAELAKRGHIFEGFLYAGLMISPSGEIKVLEFNARLGDPETQVIMRRMLSDFGEVMHSLMSAEKLAPECLWSEDSAVCLVMASKGYPESSSKGDVISGVSNANELHNVVVFHAGTANEKVGDASEVNLTTAGGRVLGLTAVAANQNAARELVYRAAERITFNGAQFRSDIAK